ncbi:unnamed protein product [Sphagnum balticum]
MVSTSTAPGSGTLSAWNRGLILAGVAISVVATGKLLQYFIYSPGQTSTSGNPSAEIADTGAHPGVQVQRNEIAPSGRTDGTTTNVVAAVPTPANNEVQVQVVIEAPPSSPGHPTDAQNAMVDVFTTTYRMIADYMLSTFSSGTFW